MSSRKSVMEIQVRYSDLDTLGHVNNSVYQNYFEMGGRIMFLESAGFPPHESDRHSFVVAHMEVDYIRPVHLGGDRITLETELETIGNTSLTFRHTLYRDGTEVCARARAVLVYRENGQKARVPDALRALLREGHIGTTT
ncbi:acyl-CoA thioesterase [Thermogymnomonas acidicola]|uniref:acyl-CoA thioesterase n=1 Tax=Thermogymnomonas acidicola TaxID=399579 RepID=UPI001494FAA3|nr:thioesterase family protein [Thermogymnomonas acidicola]